MIITIGREYGSGGREIGGVVAKKLQIPFYDKEILTRAAQDSGLCPEVLEHHDEHARIGYFFSGNAFHEGSLGSTLQMPLPQRVFLAQFEAIGKLAAEGPCVIVGRCADYVLREREDVFHVFLYAGEEKRIERIMRVENCDEDKARELIRKTDKERKNYYNFYTDGDWGCRGKYDAMLRTDNHTADEMADVIILLAKGKIGEA